MTQLRTFSFGGGVQSMAALVLSARGEIDYPIHLFSNVGADSENPATIKYFHAHAKPYAEANGIQLIELHRIRRDGRHETLYQRLMRANRSIPIPVRMANGAPGRRTCTIDFKIKVVGKWQKQNGATKDRPAITGMGISMDEFRRMKTASMIPWQTLDYPLITRRITREDCKRIIAEAGLPVPPKSSCYFCPFHNVAAWQEIRDETPELFQKAADLEVHLNGIRERLGRDQIYFSRRLKPLPLAVPAAVLEGAEAEDDLCDSGVCFV